MKIKRKIPGRAGTPAAVVLTAFCFGVLAAYAAALGVIAGAVRAFAFLERLQEDHGQRDEYADDEDDDGHGGVYPGLLQDRTPSTFASPDDNGSR